MKLSSLRELDYVEVSHNPKIKKQILLGNDALPNLISFSCAVFPPGEMAGAHSHADMSEVFFVQSGRGVINIDGKEYPLEKGVCAAVEVGEEHEIRNTGFEDLVLSYFAIKAD